MEKDDITYLEETVKNGKWLKISVPSNYIREVAVYTRDGESLQRETVVKGETLNFALTRAALQLGGAIDSSERDAELISGYAHPNSYIDYLLLKGYYISIGADEENYILKFWHKDQDSHRCNEIYSTTAPNTTSLLTLLRNVEVTWARYLVEPLSNRQDIIDIKDKNEFLKH